MNGSQQVLSVTLTSRVQPPFNHNVIPRLSWSPKNFEICDWSVERARLQPRRTWFPMAYGTAEAMPFQNFGSRRVFLAACYKEWLRTSRDVESACSCA